MTIILLLWEIFVLIITTTYVYYIYQTVSKVKKTTAKLLQRIFFSVVPIDFNVIFLYSLYWHRRYNLHWHCVTSTLVVTFCYIHTCVDTLLHPHLCWHSVTPTLVLTLCYIHSCVDTVTSTLVLTLCYIHTCCDTVLHSHLCWHSVTSTLVLTLCYWHSVEWIFTDL